VWTARLKCIRGVACAGGCVPLRPPHLLNRPHRCELDELRTPWRSGQDVSSDDSALSRRRTCGKRCVRMLNERAEQGTWGGWTWLRDALEPGPTVI
jgi:hypothetical protein